MTDAHTGSNCACSTVRTVRRTARTLTLSKSVSVCACAAERGAHWNISAALEDLAQEAAACRRIWATVALVAIADADDDPMGPAGRYLASCDFLDVCDLAGLYGAAAQERVARLGGGGSILGAFRPETGGAVKKP